MSGSGARDGYGSPPWDPADPVPDVGDTQAIPGLGTVPGANEPPRRAGGVFGSGDGAGYRAPGGSWPGAGADAWQRGYGDPRSRQARTAFGVTRDDLGAIGPDTDTRGGRDGRDGTDGGGAQGRAEKAEPGSGGRHSKGGKRRRRN